MNRFIVAQIGARRAYAVPLILEQAGWLERFHTDLAGNVGPGKWLVKCGPFCGFRNAAARLGQRRVPEALKAKTVTLGWGALCFPSRDAFARHGSVAQFRRQLRLNQAMGASVVRHGFRGATHLYSMLGECGPAVALAKERGLVTVNEIYILLSSERIVVEEQRVFCTWEPALPNFDLVRSEFPSEYQFLHQTDLAVCPSPAVARDAERNFGFSGRSAVVPYCVDAHWPCLPLSPIPGRVLFVGTAGLRKGIHYLAMAAERLEAKGRRYEFRVAGDVIPSVTNQPACRHLTFLGRVPREQIRAEYASADVFVLPSVAEGSAEATYEAMAAWLPVITTQAAGSVVRDGIEGCLIPERDPIALANAIEQVIENRRLRTELSHAAQRRAREFSLERYGERLLAALQT